MLCQDRHHLRRDGQQATDFTGFKQRRTHVDGDHHLGTTALAYLLHRQVVHQAAIHKLAPAVLQRGHQARHRHAGAHGQRQAAITKHHAVTTANIGGDDGHRQGQQLDIAFAGVGMYELVKKEFDLLARHHTRRRDGTQLGDAGLAAGQVALRQALAAVVDIAIARVVLKQIVPVGLAHFTAHGGRVHARRPSTCNQRTHAGAGHAVHRYAQALQLFQHADVRRPACAATAQHQAHFGAVCGIGCGWQVGHQP